MRRDALDIFKYALSASRVDVAMSQRVGFDGWGAAGGWV